MAPADETALFQAFTDHEQALNGAPNSVAKETIRKAEDPKLCAAIKNFKQFTNWTAEVRSISKPADNSDEVEITLTLNGSLAGYLATDHIRPDSPLYPKIAALKDGFFHASDVMISGTVIRATKGTEALQNVDDDAGVALECTELSYFDVKLTSIEPL